MKVLTAQMNPFAKAPQSPPHGVPTVSLVGDAAHQQHLPHPCWSRGPPQATQGSQHPAARHGRSLPGDPTAESLPGCPDSARTGPGAPASGWRRSRWPAQKTQGPPKGPQTQGSGSRPSLLGGQKALRTAPSSQQVRGKGPPGHRTRGWQVASGTLISYLLHGVHFLRIQLK